MPLHLVSYPADAAAICSRKALRYLLGAISRYTNRSAAHKDESVSCTDLDVRSRCHAAACSRSRDDTTFMHRVNTADNEEAPLMYPNLTTACRPSAGLVVLAYNDPRLDMYAHAHSLLHPTCASIHPFNVSRRVGLASNTLSVSINKLVASASNVSFSGSRCNLYIHPRTSSSSAFHTAYFFVKASSKFCVNL